MSTFITQELVRARQAEIKRDFERAASVRRAIAERDRETKRSQRPATARLGAWLRRLTRGVDHTQCAAHA